MLSDDELLQVVANERRRSIGFDNDDELIAQREQALNYAKGVMDDVPALPNRSTAVSSDVSDAIETALPDLVEIFIGGDDVATFQALGPEDEERAKQETEYVQHVIFDQNSGFLLFYSIIKDALTCKLGVAKSWIEEGEDVSEEEHRGVPAEYLPVIQAQAEAQGAEIEDVEHDEEAGTVAFTVVTRKRTSSQRNMAVPPEDFTFASDTVALRDATYCAMRSRPRAQALVDDGYDADLVESLPEYGSSDTDTLDLARDTAGESRDRHGSGGGQRALRTVEIVEHYIRIDANADGKTELYKIVTGGGETTLLDKEEVDAIPFACITPYIVPHRLLGRSLADLLLEIQRIKTALLRMLLDSGYFALNQRLEVATDQSNQWTISDLLRNEPGMPIRSKTGTAVRPVSAGGLNFDVTGALEYISTVSEQRTGIVRNAQGLNPDTLHDTAEGARQLIAAAQKRIRMIARVFAETGVKDLFLNVHQLLRKSGQATTVQLGGKWAEVDPSTWPARKGLKVEIGVGSGGREHDIISGAQLLQMLQTAVEGQGGLNGPLTNAEGISKALKRQTARLGFKNEEQYWADPAKFAEEQAKQPPPPDPAMVEAQQKAALAQQEATQKANLAREQAMEQARLDEQKASQAHELKMAEINAKYALEQEQLVREMELKTSLAQAEMALKRQVAEHQSATNQAVAASKMSANGSDVEPGGEPG